MKIGLITYHSAYNFGSVLQAYATQETIRKIAGNCEIINYRTREQKRYYSIFKIEKSTNIIKSVAKNVLSIPLYVQKRDRQKKYEELFKKIFNLSEECEEPEDVYNIWEKYDLIVAGSDQIWNKYSNELNHVSWKYMYPYILHGYKGKKISYASSPANMTIDDINNIIEDLRKFDYISFREKRSCDFLNKTFKLNAMNVLDPTFLLQKDDWIKKMQLNCIHEENYILYYALGSRKETSYSLKKLKSYADEKKLKVKVIAPLTILNRVKDVEFIYNADPVDFLNLINNAKIVITDSYHGTILSVNFNKEIYSFCRNGGADFRKSDILTRLGLKERIIKNIDDFINEDKKEKQLNYSIINTKLNSLREKSMKYLIDSIK